MSKPEVFVSIDIETDGPVPGLNSMLSLGAVAYAEDETELSRWYQPLSRLPGARQDPGTMDWWKGQPEAWHEVTTGPIDPEHAIPDFVNWCVSLPGKPVAVAWPAAFDFSFVNYYCWYFVGRNPLGFAALDIRSYANGLAGYPSYYGLKEKQIHKMAGHIDKTGLRPHVALDDAIEQGRLFLALRRHALLRVGE
jgi:DNA polymerase III epsilon subunit-like protein